MPDKSSNLTSIVKMDERRSFDRKLYIAYAILIGLWIFDFKGTERGVGVISQALILLCYVSAFAVILIHALWQRYDWGPVLPTVLFGSFFLIFSIAVGGVAKQDYWLLFTNSIPIFLFLSAAFSTYIVFSYSENRNSLLEVLKTICVATIVCHMVIAVFQYGLDLSKTRHQFLSGASIPALAIFAMFLIFPVKKKELLIAISNLIVVLISVTRTQLLALAVQISVCIAIFPGSFFNYKKLQKILGIIFVISIIIAIDVVSGVGLTSRWTDRLMIQDKFGTDPTALTRTAENNYMRQEIMGSWQSLVFGNGLAAETSLIGPEAILAGQLVGRASVSIHSYGFGHNNHLSLLFIGGVLAGLPFVILLFMNGVYSMQLSRTLLKENNADSALIYASAWSSLIIVGLLTIGFFSGTFEERATSLWYGVGVGMFCWARNENKKRKNDVPLKNSSKSSIKNSGFSRYVAMSTFLMFCLAFIVMPTNAIAQITLTADTNKPTTSTFAAGEVVDILFIIDRLRVSEVATLNLEVQNENGVIILKPDPIKLVGDTNGKARFSFSAPTNKLGYYEVKAKLSDGTTLNRVGTREAGFITYAVVPNPAERVNYGDTHSRFGLQGGFNKSVVILPYLGARYVIYGNDWARMEPTMPGQFAQDLAKATAIGKRHPPKSDESENPIFQGRPWVTFPVSSITSASLPSWAMKAGTSGTICKTFGALDDSSKKALSSFALAQAKEFSRTYKAQISRHYQVTWEPANGWCYKGTASELVEFYSNSFESIHRGDQFAIVSGPTLFIDSESTKQLSELFSAGLASYIDALSVHPYVHKFPPEKNGLPSILKEQLNIVKKAAGRQLPFIGTEHGFKSTTVGNLNKALGDVRTTLIMLGEGALFDMAFYAADFWDGIDPAKTDGYGFYWNLNPKIIYGADKLGPKVVVPAYAAMTFFIDGTTTKGSLIGLTGSQMGYRFFRESTTSSTTIDVVWDYSVDSQYTVPQGATVCDWMGNCAQEGQNCTPNGQSQITIDGAPKYVITKTFKKL